jgi:hypothetical protein
VEADEGEPPIMAKYEYMAAHPRGFSEDEMRGALEGAGLENVAFECFVSGKKEGRDVQFFLATHQACFRMVKNPFVVELVDSFSYEYNNMLCMEYE